MFVAGGQKIVRGSGVACERWSGRESDVW